ncbi:MAG: MerR family transcriptional regulator [Bacteroidales bacterium]|jgi:DNA-binding transcriptional MerR regulator
MNVAKYSISDLEKLTGIKAHTIRIWEKRYSIISPERTDTNIRYYSVTDLQRLLNISFLNRHGFKISHISEMSDMDITDEVGRICEIPGAEDGSMSELLKATNELDEDRFERLLNGTILKLGFEQTFQLVVFPLLEKIDLLWQIGKISACQERFVNNLIKHKLVVAIDGMVGHNQSTNEHFLLFLPLGLYDEINLLYANYLLRKVGHQVIYLGPSIPVENLRSLSNREIIDSIVVSVNQGFTERELASYGQKLAGIFPGKRVFLVSIGFDSHVELPPEIVKISDFQSFAKSISGRTRDN